MEQITDKGKEIECKSFATIDREAGPHSFSPEHWRIVQRVIHSTADFDFKDALLFGTGSVTAGIKSLQNGAMIIADVRMIAAGLNQSRLSIFGNIVQVYNTDPDVYAAAQRNGNTRALEAMRKAARMNTLDGAIVAIGNAPTALIELCRLIRAGSRPALVIGVPVGFVSAVESKDELMKLDVPWIATKGRKGGAAVAVAIIHALLTLDTEK